MRPRVGRGGRDGCALVWAEGAEVGARSAFLHVKKPCSFVREPYIFVRKPYIFVSGHNLFVRKQHKIYIFCQKTIQNHICLSENPYVFAHFLSSGSEPPFSEPELQTCAKMYGFLKISYHFDQKGSHASRNTGMHEHIAKYI